MKKFIVAVFVLIVVNVLIALVDSMLVSHGVITVAQRHWISVVTSIMCGAGFATVLMPQAVFKRGKP